MLIKYSFFFLSLFVRPQRGKKLTAKKPGLTPPDRKDELRQFPER